MDIFPRRLASRWICLHSEPEIFNETIRVFSIRAVIKHGKPHMPGSTVTQMSLDCFPVWNSSSDWFLCSFGNLLIQFLEATLLSGVTVQRYPQHKGCSRPTTDHRRQTNFIDLKLHPAQCLLDAEIHLSCGAAAWLP